MRHGLLHLALSLVAPPFTPSCHPQFYVAGRHDSSGHFLQLRSAAALAVILGEWMGAPTLTHASWLPPLRAHPSSDVALSRGDADLFAAIPESECCLNVSSTALRCVAAAAEATAAAAAAAGAAASIVPSPTLSSEPVRAASSVLDPAPAGRPPHVPLLAPAGELAAALRARHARLAVSVTGGAISLLSALMMCQQGRPPAQPPPPPQAMPEGRARKDEETEGGETAGIVRRGCVPYVEVRASARGGNRREEGDSKAERGGEEAGIREQKK